MADNITLNVGSAGAVVAALSDGAKDYPVGTTAYVTGGSAGAWTLQVVDLTHGLPVGDAGGSLTVDAPVGTPAFVRLSDGAAPISILPVSGTVTANIGTGNLAGITGTVTVDTELPAAAALADATANPTVPGVGGFLMGFNGTTWDRAPGNTSGMFGQGNVASGVADAGNPVKIGGKGATAPSAVTAGQRVDLWTGLNGQVVVAPCASGAITDATALGAAAWWQQASTTTVLAAVVPFNFNGANSDRARNNHEVTVTSSGAQTVTFNSADQTNFNGRGVQVVINVSAQSGTTPTLDAKLQAKDTLSGQYVDIPGASFTQWAAATGAKRLVAFPGATPVANAKVDDLVPRVWRIAYTIGGTTPSFTLSAAANYVN